MRRKSISTVLAVSALLTVALACASTRKDSAEPAHREVAETSGDYIAYEGPQHPGDSEWLLQSLNGQDAAEGRKLVFRAPD